MSKKFDSNSLKQLHRTKSKGSPNADSGACDFEASSTDASPVATVAAELFERELSDADLQAEQQSQRSAAYDVERPAVQSTTRPHSASLRRRPSLMASRAAKTAAAMTGATNDAGDTVSDDGADAQTLTLRRLSFSAGTDEPPNTMGDADTLSRPSTSRPSSPAMAEMARLKKGIKKRASRPSIGVAPCDRAKLAKRVREEKEQEKRQEKREKQQEKRSTRRPGLRLIQLAGVQQPLLILLAVPPAGSWLEAGEAFVIIA